MIKIYCQICKIQTKYSKYTFYRHLKTHNITMKEYYDKYIKKENDGICLTCKNKTKFRSFGQGYAIFCSSICSNNNQQTKIKKSETCFINYGVKNPAQSKIIYDKTKKTKLQKYGYEYIDRDKSIITCLERYGVGNYASSKEYRQYKESIGDWLSLKNSSKWKIYFLEVWKETNKHKKKLFKNWNGLDYYTKEKLISNKEFRLINPEKHTSNNLLQPTIDHKISIKYGLENNINPKEIGSFKNLCICSRRYNSKKNYKNNGAVGIETEC